jgi:aspartyl-tRNA(Asn)/glutamyl-tRNA(Gln) amidotransferase subunit A
MALIEETVGSSAAELAAAVRRGERRATEIAEAHLSWIEAVEPDIQAFLAVTADWALACARKIDEACKSDSADEEADARLPLAGVPLSIKDVLCTEGIPTTCASKILEGWKPPYTATAVKRALAAGAIPVGKTNMDEFAMGSSTENSAFFPTKNPWDTERVPGGSSGGSAASCASLQAPISLGSDTGGSVRQPASFCGVVGLKPTYGRVSRYGLVAFASSLDQIGPLGRTVRDTALLFDVISGHDPADSTSIPDDVVASYASRTTNKLKVRWSDYRERFVSQPSRRRAGVPGPTTAAIEAGLASGSKPLEGLRIGVVTELLGDAIAEEIRRAVSETCDLACELGAEVEEVSLPSFEYALSAYYLIAPAEASSNLARYDGVRYGSRVQAEDTTTMMKKTRGAGFGPEVKRRIMLGTYALSAGYYEAYYGTALKVRTLVARDFAKAFDRNDVLLSPTSPTTAFKLGERIDDPLAMYLSDLCTIPANLAGIPAVSLPVGLDSSGLPIGMQLMGPILGEEVIMAVAACLESAVGFNAKPPLVTRGRSGPASG